MNGEPPRPGGGGTVDVVRTVKHGPSAAAVSRWAAAVLASALPRGVRRRPPGLCVLLCADVRMRSLNRRFMGEDRPTDVLSFPSGEPGFLGDVAIDVSYAGRQARRRSHSLEREVKLLLAHGVLHLLGHDHEVDGGRMFRLQGRLVRKVFGRGPDGVPGEGSA